MITINYLGKLDLVLLRGSVTSDPMAASPDTAVR